MASPVTNIQTVLFTLSLHKKGGLFRRVDIPCTVYVKGVVFERRDRYLVSSNCNKVFWSRGAIYCVLNSIAR